MDSAMQYAYLFDIGWFLLFTCVPMLLIAALVLARSGLWVKTGSEVASESGHFHRKPPD
jgi:hypothetical protein